jgi:hypothetical protein
MKKKTVLFFCVNGNSIDFETAVGLVRDNCSEPLFSLYLHGMGSLFSLNLYLYI